MVFYFILLGLIIAYFPRFYRFVKEVRRMKRLSSVIPGDEGVFFAGHGFEFGMDPQVMPHRAVARMNRTVKESGMQLMKLWFIHENVYMPTNGETAKYILDSNDEITKGVEYDVLVPWLGTGLLISTGDKWKSRRKMLTPTFHFSMLDGYLAIMNRHSKICTELLEDRAGTKVYMYPVVKMCALDIICGKASHYYSNGGQFERPQWPYVEAIVNLMSLGTKIAMSFHLWTPLARYLLGIQQSFDRSLIIAHKFTRSVIEERTEALKRGEVEPNKRAFLDLLLELKEQHSLNDEDIREEVDTFMFEGHDTTSSGMGWLVWCLAGHQDIQERAYEEVMKVLDNFLPERVAARNAYDYIPFSAGPRNCIGQKFAQYEEKIMTAWLLRRFRFESEGPLASQRFAAEAILRPIDGINVMVFRR